jgi:hypothetical protein
VRGLLPLRQVVTVLGPGFRRQLAEARAAARRTLEDHGLANVAPTDDPAAWSAPPVAEAEGTLALKSLVGQLLHRLVLAGVDDEVLAQLEADLECAGRQTARRAVQGLWGRCLVVVANAIPAGALCWVLQRLGTAWWVGTYFPLPFYGMALLLLAASFLPGCWLLAWALGKRGRSLDVRDVVRQVEEPVATAALRTTRQRLHRFAQRAWLLRRALGEARRTLEREGDLLAELHGVVPTDGEGQPGRDLSGVGLR